jgi:DNA polymerase-1
VIAKFGIEPQQMIDFLALTGDSVDNIPGIPKVGPKTAAKWLNEYHSLANLVEHATEIKGKIGENLRQHLDLLPLYQSLVTIKLDVPLPLTLDALRLAPPNEPILYELYHRLEFNSWLKDLSHEMPSNTEIPTEYHTVSTWQALEQLLDTLAQQTRFCIDLETNSLDPRHASIVGIAIAYAPNSGYYIPLAHQHANDGEQLPIDAVLQKFKPLLVNPKVDKIGHNLKYDLQVLSRYALPMSPLHDTMLQSYVYHSTASRHGLDALAKFYLQQSAISFAEVAGKGAKQITFDGVAIDKATEYAAQDADFSLQLHEQLWPKLAANSRLYAVYESIELPLISVLAQMESCGVKIDAQLLSQQSEELSQRLVHLANLAYQFAGETFNLASPKQLQHIFYEKLGFPVLEKTPTGQPSTSETVLQELKYTYELAAVILEHRQLSKLKSTYLDSLPLQIHPITHRVHTSYQQAVTATGRLSSTEPNLQNIPIRTLEGRKIRQAFIAEPGFTLVAADYSQIELRIMAHLSQDAGLLAAFQQEQDIHQFTASEVFHIPLDQVSASQRRSAKAINFGLIYGMSAYGLARQLEITQAQAKTYIEQYFARYPGVQRYMAQIRETAAKHGYVETVYGRRLYLPEINAKNGLKRKAAERTAINAPMQGTAADIIKRAMQTVQQWINTQSGKVTMIMQVHDELVFEVRQDFISVAMPQIQQLMQAAATLSVPLKVEIAAGANWDEAH